MLSKAYAIPLDIKSGRLTMEIIELVSGDNGTSVLEFSLFENEHIPYNLENTEVNILVKLPNGKREKQACIVDSSNVEKSSLTLKLSLISQPGEHLADLQIYDSEAQIIRLTTPTFKYYVRQSLSEVV